MSLFLGKIFSAISKTAFSIIVSLGLVSAPLQPKTNVVLKPSPIIQKQIVSTQQNLPMELSNHSTIVQQKSSNVNKNKASQPIPPPAFTTPEIKIPTSETTPITTPVPIPTTIRTPNPQAPTYVPPQIPSTTSAPVPQPILPSPVSTEPAPSEISIQNQICNLSQTNLKTQYIFDQDHLLANYNTDGRIFMDAYVLDQNGQNFYNNNPTARMTISTSDHSNDKVLNGSGNTGPCGFYYPFEFYVSKPGTYTIDYSVLGLSKSITITVN